MGVIILVIAFIFIYTVMLSEKTRDTSLTANWKKWAIENNEIAYFDYGANTYRDIRTDIPVKVMTDHVKVNGEDRMIEFITVESTPFQPSRMIRARWFGGPGHRQDIPLSELKKMETLCSGQFIR